jgi:cytochrome P450
MAPQHPHALRPSLPIGATRQCPPTAAKIVGPSLSTPRPHQLHPNHDGTDSALPRSLGAARHLYLVPGTAGLHPGYCLHWFEDWTTGLFSVPLPLPWTQFGKALRNRQLLLQEIGRIIRERQPQSDPGQDALGLLIQARDEQGNGLSVEELQDQILTLLFAGHETLTSAIATFCFKVAQHPTVLSKLRTEQAQFQLDQPLTLESLKQMEYLEQVLKEVLRILPPVGGGFREVIQTCEINSYTILKGWSVLYEIGRTHQNPHLYPDPNHFDPDRFAPLTGSEKAKPFSYVPFGGGIRECLGKEFARLEMKIFAALLLRNAEWTLLPDQNLEFITIPTPRLKDGLKVQFGCLRA